MGQTITISPVTRIEGHARITIRLDDTGSVADARLQVQEFRGFESFCVGRPYWEMPAITARICGICPASHALAAAMAGDALIGLPIPPAAYRLRTILSLAQIILSHSLSFFHLSAPDIVFGLASDPAERNIVGLAKHHPELLRKGIRLRQIGQEIVNRVGGGHLHPEYVCAGGMRQPLSAAGRDAIASLLTEARDLVGFAFRVWEEHRDGFLAAMGECPEPVCLSLGLVGEDGCLDHLTGRLRFVEATGQAIAELSPDEYNRGICETVAGDSYMKPTESLVADNPHYRVGPLARLRVAPFRDAPQAEQARLFFQADPLSSSPPGYHQARLIEMLYAVERLIGLIGNPEICDPHVLVKGDVVNAEGIGVTEAPRGSLIHHYRVDRHGLLTNVNLVVATGHNSRAMDRTITAIARRHLTGDMLSEGLLNRVEHGIRLYDPCLSCATHLHGGTGLRVDLLAPDGKVLDSIRR